MKLSDIFETIQSVLNARLFTIGQTDITLSSLIVFIVLFFLVILFSRFLARRILDRFLRKLQISNGTRFVIRRMTEYSLIIVGAVIAFQTIGLNLSGLAVIFGLLSVGIGFGLQNVTSNFIAGLILLFERPIKVGDRVTVGDVEGDVLMINMRSTTIQSLNNIAIIVPNSQFISDKVVNWSHGDSKIRLDINVGVSYGSDLDAVLKALQEVAKENSDVLENPKPVVHFRDFGDSAWNMQLRIWILNPKKHYNVRSDIHCAIVRKFREKNIEIAFPQRDIHLRSAAPLPVEIKSKNDM
ncbi:MAG: mechanosensitive ion channel [Candidatus Aminicenantes bacterium]|nr:mechanosensitive ion channel [Candidatus Aminicenantes bacterium]